MEKFSSLNKMATIKIHSEKEKDREIDRESNRKPTMSNVRGQKISKVMSQLDS
jgi:hypothetical protein